MKKLLSETFFIIISLIISFFIYRLITLRLLDFVPFNMKYRIIVYIGIVLFQAIFIYIIVKALAYKQLETKYTRILWGEYFFILTFILFGRTIGFRGIELNIINSIKSMFDNSYSVVITISNSLLFVPVGYLLKDKNPFKSIIMALCLFLCIESAQYIFSLGIFDIGDILLYLIGYSLGYYITPNIIHKISVKISLKS